MSSVLRSHLARLILTDRLKLCLQSGLKSFTVVLATLFWLDVLRQLFYKVYLQAFALGPYSVIVELDSFSLSVPGLKVSAVALGGFSVLLV